MCISCYSALLLEKGNFAHEVSLCNRDLDVLTMCRMAQSEPPNPSVGLCGHGPIKVLTAARKTRIIQIISLKDGSFGR